MKAFNDKKKAICILGGIGPQASLYMCKLLIKLAVRNYGVKNNEQFPEIILDSIPMPGFIANKSEREIALEMLQKRVNRLKKLNIMAFAITCNTAHVLIKKLQPFTKIPFISIIDEVTKEVEKDQIKKVGLLSSPSTVKYNLYQKSLNKAGIEVIIPTKQEQGFFEEIVNHVLEENITNKDQKRLLAAADNLQRKGAEGIILGCTELPLVFPAKYNLPIYNSLEILAYTLLQTYYDEN